MYNYCFLPRTTTVDVHFAKYHYRRAPKDLVATSSSPNVNVYFHDCCKNNYFHDVREPLPSPRRCWIRQVPLRKTNVYHYFHDARERLPPRRPVNVYEMYHYRRPVNVYFPLRTRTVPFARYKGIATEIRPRTNACVV